MLQHSAQAGAERDPHLLKRLGGTGVFDLLRSLAAHAHERTLDSPDDVREIQLVGWLGEPVAALRSALATDDARGAQLREDVLEERDRYALGLRHVVDLARGFLAAARQLDDRADGIVGLRGHVHRVILPETAAAGIRGWNPDLCGRS
jgi:hypothetical protein